MANEIALAYWLNAIESNKKAILATVLTSKLTEDLQLSSKRLFLNKELQIGKLGNRRIERQVIKQMWEKLGEEKPESEKKVFLLENGEKIRVFLDVFFPPAEILIFGAGLDAIPLAAYSVSLGYRTTVVDARENINTEERFPETRRIIAGEKEIENIPITNRTYIIVMNHHLEKDEKTLSFALKSESPYVGLLGPYSRRVKIMNRLQDLGFFLTREELGRMYSPIGLDIGARSPEEIAISILAEIIALEKGHTGGFLQDSTVIHK